MPNQDITRKSWLRIVQKDHTTVSARLFLTVLLDRMKDSVGTQFLDQKNGYRKDR